MDGCDNRYSILESVGVFCCSCIANVVGLRRKPFSFPPFLFLSHLTLFPYRKEVPDEFRLFGVVLLFFFLLTFGFLLSCPCETARWSRLA